jgi:hypothetical protein
MKEAFDEIFKVDNVNDFVDGFDIIDDPNRKRGSADEMKEKTQKVIDVLKKQSNQEKLDYTNLLRDDFQQRQSKEIVIAAISYLSE